jgi:hypothetical protein
VQCNPTADGLGALGRDQIPGEQGWHFSPRFFAGQNTFKLVTVSMIHATHLTPPGSDNPTGEVQGFNRDEAVVFTQRRREERHVVAVQIECENKR